MFNFEREIDRGRGGRRIERESAWELLPKRV